MKKRYFLTFIFTVIAAIAAITPSTLLAQGVKVIVIDPGHGGKFPGAHYRGVTEKELNLKVALKLGSMIHKAHPEIKIVYTRKTDIALGTTLKADLAARNRIANESKGDLFISIHANAASNTSAHGTESIIMGESSLEEQRNFEALYTANKDQLVDMSDEKNAAIVRAYIENYQYTYGQYSEALARLVQKGYANNGRNTRPLRRQPLMVLYGTDMPCILTEIGFMTNPSEFAFINSSKGQDVIAKSIFEGINEYIKVVNKLSGGGHSQPISSKPSINSGYTVQIFASATQLPSNDRQFKSYASKQWMISGSGRFKYKYCVGKYATRKEAEVALKEIKKSFKEAYIVNF